MTKLGYTNDLPRPCNVAIQATVASIRAEEIHRAIQGHERQALASQHEDEPGQFLMRLLGLDEWFNIYLLAQQSGIQMTIQRLREYAEFLEYMEGEDAYDLQKALVVARTMDAALTKVAKDTAKAREDLLNPPPPPPITLGPILTFFAPVLTPSKDGCMWKIKNINNLAPISIDMWQAWGTISDVEVLQCRERALHTIPLSDKAPVFVSHWPMTVFGTPKYKCPIAAGAKVKGKMDTTTS
ncbi:unnamed protein product [Calypogeia fissa]